MSLLNTAYLKSLRERFQEFIAARRDVIAKASEAQHAAKGAIFALQRGSTEEASGKLKQSEIMLSTLTKKYKGDKKILSEGALVAAIEEYVEANLFYQFIASGNIGKITAVALEDESYLAGLCDVPGELYRYAIRAATNRDIDLVKKCAEAANEIIGELIQFNLTSYLRTKFDQAKQAAQKIEQVVYEVSLKNER